MTYAAYRSNGFAVAPNAITAQELSDLRGICDALTAEQDAGPKAGEHDINLANRRFLAHRHGDFPALADFILRSTGARLAREYLACDQPYLFNEQFVVKGAGDGGAFAWHQDGAYVGFDHAPYLSVWIALDDVSQANGCVRVLPRDLDSDETLVPHRDDPVAKNLIGYDGDDPGVPAEGPAGTAVMFSSATLHCSGNNTSGAQRRALLVQYSSEPICWPDTGKVKRFATPVG